MIVYDRDDIFYLQTDSLESDLKIKGLFKCSHNSYNCELL